MRAVRWTAWILVAGAAACGSGEPAALHVQIPPLLTDAISGCNTAGLNGLKARLDIAGHAPCNLSVAADFTVSGSCEDIATGERRGLVIQYSLAAPFVVPLAYAVGEVDLRDIALRDHGDEPVLVELSSDDLIYSEAQLNAAAPAGGCAARDRTDATQWAVCHIRDELGAQLVCGDASGGPCVMSTTSNLDRACSGSIVCCPVP